ncbi:MULTISPECIES: FGGY-family carbohydrate kinase [unclassified Ensifer]|uniref:FGGY-family carbohydrate kinase n=1 Tax=unclassified Ensifer TaxID=2633371 RepID=UPI00081364D1|nr:MULTISPECIES: FGGY-family carbohydrate kinase [unclassified Ensifer]OCP19360.1 carbohydrate kinase [Ensifer sp. LC54]OCP19515.1 carbohydrate kinase [Ensifer sp. LC384]
MTCLLGIDNGLTVTKAVVFDLEGTPLAVARRRVAQSLPHPRWVERDPLELWRATAEAIREAVQLCGRAASEIKAVAATAHGDGLYLLDRACRPLGPGILSLDSRAGALSDEWNTSDVAGRAIELTGQLPHASAPSAILAWIKRHQPERYAAIGHVFACKDWLRFCLSGTIGTDRTEASTSFTNVMTQEFDRQALSIFGLEELWQALPVVSASASIVGGITREAAELTGLAEGTPVACGLHDVTASALGIGGHQPQSLSIVAGTYSINEIVTDRPLPDARWYCRNAIDAGQWNNMAISPASTANYDWFLDNFCRAELEQAEREGCGVHDLLRPELDRAFERPSDIVFHPFLFGSPFGSGASAGFFGVHGWHDRGDMLKAVLEGIVFNHKTHIEDLRSAMPIRDVRISGGGARNPALSQMFADAIGLPVLVSSADEAAAWGAALTAGAAIGLYDTSQEGARKTTTILRRHEPDPVRGAALADRFNLYRQLAEAMTPHWHAIEELARRSREKRAT